MKIPQNPKTLLTLAILLIVCLVTACTDLEPAPGTTSVTTPSPSSPFDPTTPPPPPTGPLLAYRAADELGLVDGTSVVATAPGAFDASNDLITTEDGGFVFARTTDGQVVTLDVATGDAATRAVPVGPVLGTVGPSSIVWWEQPNRLMQLDLADPDSQPVLQQTVDFPPVAGIPPAEPRLIVARGGTAVLARVEGAPTPSGGPDTLYAVHGPGAPSLLGQADANTPVSTARLSADGASLAYALYRSTDSTCGTAAVVVSDAAGSQQIFDVAGPDAATGSKVPKLWWPTTGLPKLSLGMWRCDRPETYPPLVWQVTPESIEQIVPATSALQTGDVAPGQRALILPRTGSYTDPVGTLVLEESDRRISIKDGVDAIAVIRPAP
ncbi:hypothetical protein [Mycolicibacterium hippocampi]|uniref:Lipoprotein n=1 Tax=Mycolicibacterium hippocampi TaxID=659824 RepID=A0A7I9ZHS5_9MYCO|nr:hypothetical protein [Mycolicibacterium hippocampi]GFH00188.1 hypothetical protein MHIP_06710 [Mycolicibacterium hippocampi]